MKGLFSKNAATSSAALSESDGSSKQMFRFNFFGPDEADLAILLNDDNATSKKKRKKKKNKKKSSNADQTLGKDESGSDDEEKLEAEVAKLDLSGTPPEPATSSLPAADSVAKVIEVCNQPAVITLSVTEIDKAVSSGKKKNKNKNKKEASAPTASITQNQAPPVTEKKAKAVPNPPKKTGKKAQVAKEEEDLDAIIAHYISSDPPAPKPKPNPRTPKSFTSPDKKVRIFSPHDPELDPKMRLQAKFGKGKNLVAIGPPKKRDPKWLEAPPGFEHLAPSRASAPIVGGDISSVGLGGKTAEGGGAEGSNASPFSFGFSLF
eukprot:gene25978-31371_t